MGNRLYVGNLSFLTDSGALRDAFAKFGEVTDVHLVTDCQAGQPHGFVFVTTGTSAAARRPSQGMNSASLDGRQRRVDEAEDRPGGDRRGGGFGSGSPRGGKRGRG